MYIVEEITYYDGVNPCSILLYEHAFNTKEECKKFCDEENGVSIDKSYIYNPIEISTESYNQWVETEERIDRML